MSLLTFSKRKLVFFLFNCKQRRPITTGSTVLLLLIRPKNGVFLYSNLADLYLLVEIKLSTVHDGRPNEATA